ncbi:MAG: hypothetical protein JWM11_7145 [Planctomycetaceae bacterium]|nr:hypothetical protein [Planctomycetaceae bacterium]
MKNLNRRTFLRASGVSLALPWLDACAGNLPKQQTQKTKHQIPRRMVCLNAPLGFHPPLFFPQDSGANYKLSPYLELIKEFRDDFTVMSGLSNPEVGEGHDSSYSFLTGAHHNGFVFQGGFRNTISLDQLAAEHIGLETRYPTLSFTIGGDVLSWTRTGVPIQPDMQPSGVFARLFLEGTLEQVAAQARRLRYGQSVLDQVGEQVKSMHAGLGAKDREKLDEYFTSVRELEKRLVANEEWSKKPKPKVDAQSPNNPPNVDVVACTRTWFDLIHLALQTDSTRLITMSIVGANGVPPIAGVSHQHHDLTHHGQDPKLIEELQRIEFELMKALGELFAKLKQTKEEGVSLLDRTMLFFGSNLGNASYHSTTNLPILLAGGGFKHGRHLAFDPKNHPPLCNLYVSMLQRLGIEADKFGSSTGTLTGLEIH